MRYLTQAILALSVTVVASKAMAWEYEIFAPIAGEYTVVERFDHKNRQLYRCVASIDIDANKVSARCTETAGLPIWKSAAGGPNLQKAMSNTFSSVPLGFWQIDHTTGRTEFCVFGSARCSDATPK